MYLSNLIVFLHPICISRPYSCSLCPSKLSKQAKIGNANFNIAEAGLSGGAWLLSSFAGNNYPTISTLSDELWKEAFRDSLLDPEFLLAAVAYAEIVDDIAAKDL